MGIALIVIGSLFFMYCGFSFLRYATMSADAFIAKYEEKGTEANEFHREEAAIHLKNGRIVTGMFTLLSAGIVCFGYYLHRKGRMAQI